MQNFTEVQNFSHNLPGYLKEPESVGIQCPVNIFNILLLTKKPGQYLLVLLPLERQPVQSNNIRSVLYDEAKKDLEIESHSGIIHQYQNVPSTIHTKLMNPSLMGIFFTEKIKNRFRSVCIDSEATR